MTTFGWKRKAGQNVSKDTSNKFSEESEINPLKEAVWLENAKRRKKDNLQNIKLKCEELKAEGIKLAQTNRLHDALTAWDRALNLVPNDEKILEMKSQVLLQLDLPYPAAQSAELAVKANPCWWVALQTLGRCQLGMGDLHMAKISFEKAIHLNPIEKDLWEEDLKWTIHLLKQKDTIILNEEKSMDTSENCKAESDI